ncbi:MAG: hypothetical protein J6M27_04330 [Lachnospiraceae bacterium]|nr:hypothetical protein [Lachnospiraceae bacterium]
MDRQEYRILSEEITRLSANEQFAEAAEIADQIDWRKVRSFSTLMSISEIYQLNRRYEDALELMLMAYDRNPKNRSIVYALCELYILLNDHIKALEFFSLYKRIAPKYTSGHYILQYKIQEMQGASLDDQIALLEMFTRKEYREEWVYQLAYLYHRIGLGTKCVETCNGLIATFGEGPFVIKALELKRLHAHLRPEEQRLYDQKDRVADELQAFESDEYTTERPEPGLYPEMGDADWHVKTIDMSNFNTVNLQKELAKSMRELVEGNLGSENSKAADDYMSTGEMEKRQWTQETEPLADGPDDEGFYGEEEDYPDDHTMFIPQGDYAQSGEYDENGGYYNEDGEYVEGEYAEEDGYYGEDGEYYAEEGEYTEDGEYAEEGEYVEEGGYYGEDGEYYAEEGEYSEDGEYAEEGGYTEDGEYVEEGGYTEDGEYAEEGGYSEEGEYVEEDGYTEEAEQPEDGYADESLHTEEAVPAVEEPQAAAESAASETVKETAAPVPQDSIVLGTGDLSEIRIAGISAEPQMPVTAEQTEIKAGAASPKQGLGAEEVFFEDSTSDIVIDSLPSGTNPEYLSMQRVAENVRIEEQIEKEEKAKEVPADVEVRRKKKESNSEIENMLYTAPDGQMGLAVPQSKVVEKQITGQIEISDYLADWEDKKRRQSEAQKQALEKRINDSTGPIFAGYDERVRNNMIDDLEREQKIFADKYRADDIQFRSIDEVIEKKPEPKTTLQKVTPLPEIKEAADPADADGEEHRSIWDEVHEAIEADHEKQQGVPQTTGLIDAAVEQASRLVETAAEAAPEKAEEVKDTEEESGKEESSKEETAEEKDLEEKSLEDTGKLGGYEEGFFDGEVDEDMDTAPMEEVSEELSEDDAEASAEDADAEKEAVEEEEIAYEGDEGSEEAYEDTDGEYYEDGEYEDEYYEDGDYIEDEADEEYEDGYAEEDGEYEDEYDPDEDDVDGEYVREILKGDGKETFAEEPNTAQLQEIASVLEADADRVGAEAVEEINDEYIAEEDDQELSPEEQELFREYLYSKKMYAQILEAVDQISLAPYVGNAIVTGDADSGLEKMGKCLIKEIQMIDGNFLSNRIARISGNKMNRKNIPAMFAQLGNGALLVEKASDMTRETLENIAKTLDDLQEGLFVILMDTRKDMDRLLEKYEMITGYFNARVDILPMNNNALVEYAKKYAYSREYKIDEERGVLALHQRISERQIGEHNVSTKEIEEIINAAIEHSSKPHISTFFQILSGKRYDYEDMIILREKDFL